jgi:hypothetical protein
MPTFLDQKQGGPFPALSARQLEKSSNSHVCAGKQSSWLNRARKPRRLRKAASPFGGFYAAPYQKYGLDVEILPGGAGTPTIQMVGAGSAEFGIVAADELVVARSRGNDVVAVFAVFQNNPLGIMVHASRKLTSLADVFTGGTVAMQRGLSYARLLEKKYGFDKVKIVPSPNGDVSAFLHDKNFAQQCFINEYAYYVSAEEGERVNALKRHLAEQISRFAWLFHQKHLNKPSDLFVAAEPSCSSGFPLTSTCNYRFLTSWRAISK